MVCKHNLRTGSEGFYNVTAKVMQSVKESGITEGACVVFCPHTTAGMTINENADPSVRHDFETILNNLVPENRREYTHTFEGNDDMPAHVKASLIGPDITIPITRGRLNLGTWQGIYLCEFRNHGGARRLVVTVYA